MLCKNCGKEISDSAKFCDGCGTQVETNSQQKNSIQNEIEQPKDETEKPNIEESSNEDNGSCFKIIVWLIIMAVTIFWIDPFSWFEIENGYLAEENCRAELDQNVFIITPREDQIKIKAVDGKDGNVIVKVTIKDEELLEYSLYDDDDEIYYGYVPASGNTHYYYWGADKAEVKEKMGW